MKQVTQASTTDALTIGEAARQTGLTRKAVRLYEADGLLPAVERTQSGYRLYTDHDLQVLRFIRRARALGLSLAEIKAIIALRRAGTPPSADVIALLKGRLSVIQRQVADLQSLRRTLADILQAAMSTSSRGEEVRLCSILDTDGQHAHPLSH